MGQKRTGYALSFSLWVVFGGMGFCAAQSPSSMPDSGLTDRVLVVDVKALLQNSAAGKMVRSQIDEKRAEYTKEISLKEDALRKEREILQHQTSQSPASLNQKNQDLQQKVNELDQDVQSKRQVLEKSNGDALGKIQEVMLRVIAGMAKANKSTLVLQREDVVLFDQSYDVTEQVMLQLDKDLPTLAVNFAAPIPVSAPAIGVRPSEVPAKK